MVEKLEISIEVILHATEDIKKIFKAFDDLFEIKDDEFEVENLTGHFENPITVLRIKIVKTKAFNFMKNLISGIPKNQIDEIIEDIDNRIQGSVLHLRIGKQEFVKREIFLQDKDSIKLKIYTPVYIKKDIVKTYCDLLKAK